MKRKWLAVPAIVALVFTVVAATGPGTDGRNRWTMKGDVVSLGGGTARVYVEMDGNVPVELGVALSEAALQDLPQAHGDMGGVPGHTFFPNFLPLPKENPTPFRLVELDWNPIGHEPEGLYTKPHFDFHFFLIDRPARDAITPDDSLFQVKGARLPAPEYVPAGYVAPMIAPVPNMGVHWVDPTSSELAGGKPFTTTFIYGSWNGDLVFAEPMITKEFIESKPQFSAPIAMAQRYAAPGWYPSKYSITWDEMSREYRIALAGFVRK